jgi:hypothetical protein
VDDVELEVSNVALDERREALAVVGVVHPDDTLWPHNAAQ